MPKPILVMLCLCLAAAASAFAGPDQWVEVSSTHFVVLTNASEKEARRQLDQFERMRWVFQTLFHRTNADPPAPIQVLACKNQKTFQSVEPQAYLAKGQLNLAGYFLTSPDTDYILLRLDAREYDPNARFEQNPYSTVYHEYTHLQFRSAGAWMPLWLNEGLAEFFENTQIRDKDVHLGQPNPDEILYLRENSLVPLQVLFRVDHNSPYYHQESKGSVFYAESWALTHYLMVNDSANHTGKVTAYMSLMSHGEDPVVAAQKAFGDLKVLEQELRNYINSGRYMEFVMKSTGASIDDSAFKARPVSQLEADSARAEILVNVGREKEARDLAAAVLKADPGNARAYQAMGQIESRAGNTAEARKSYAEAVKLDPKNFLAAYRYAVVSIGMDDAGDQAVAASLNSAIQLNPNFAPAFDRLAAVESRDHSKLAVAFSHEATAIKLDPSNVYYRTNAATILMQLGQDSDALKVLHAAATAATSPNESALIQNRIAEVEQMQQARAQAAQQQATAQVTQQIAFAEKPKYPAEANGPRHSSTGVIHQVTCSYPAVLEFQIESPKATIKVYSNDFTKLELTVVGFSPSGPMNPCTDFDGMKARVQYAETTDKSVDGQAISIELRK